MRELRVAAILTIVAFVLAACGTGQPDRAAVQDPAASPATTARATPTAAPTDAADVPVPAELKFSAETVVGGTFDGTTLAGKDAVLWFWAPWCTECRREAPHVAAAQASHPDVSFVGVAGLGETAAMQDFVDEYDVDAFEHLADLDGALWQRFGVVQQPAYAFIDDDGTIEVVRGELGEAGLAEQLDALASN